MNTKMNPWVCTTDPVQLRRLGKLTEELSELQKVIARILIQGIEGVDPESDLTNRQCLQKEVADVYAQLRLLVKLYQLDVTALAMREVQKIAQMQEWEELMGLTLGEIR